MYKMIKRIRSGGGRTEDLDIMLHMANNMGIMPGTTICGLADGAAWPVKNAITKFRGELEDYIRQHQSAAARVTPLQENVAHGIPASSIAGLQLPVVSKT
jgi:NADH-quinone oxidoreductase subunit F